MKMTRVTLVSLWSQGGMLHYVARLSAALAKQPSLTVTVVLPDDADSYLFADNVHLCRVSVPAKWTVSSLLHLISGLALISVYRAIKSTRPEIIHFNSSHPLLIVIGPLLARNFTTVATVHDAVSHPGADESFRKSLERRAMLRHADRVFVHRDIIREQLLKSYGYVNAEKVVVTPHGNYDFFAEFENQHVREPATLLFFGRISVYKGLRYLVQAVETVRDRVPDFRVIVAGSGDFEPEVAAKLGSSIYEVHNRFVEDAEVAVFFRRATAVVLPYVEASESGVIRVAEAFERPVISTRVGGIPEAIRDGETGLIVEPADAAGLAHAIEQILTNRALRERIEKNLCAAKALRPDWGDAANILRREYRKLLGANGEVTAAD